MLVSILPKLSVLQFMEDLKAKSALMIFDNHANSKYKLKNYKVILKYVQQILDKSVQML